MELWLKKQYEEALIRVDRIAHREFLHAYSNSDDGEQLAWAASRVPRALLLAYEASGNEDYLDIVETDILKWLANRSDRLGNEDHFYHKLVPGWTTGFRKPTQPQCYFMHTSLLVDVMAKWAYLAMREPKLYRRYGKVAHRVLNDCQECLELFFDDAWMGNRYGKHHITTQTAPMNHQTAMGRAFLYMWLATGTELYYKRAFALAGFFRSHLDFLGDEGYVWDHLPYERLAEPGGEAAARYGVEDIIHATISFSFAAECWRAGINGYDDAFMWHLGRTYERTLRLASDDRLAGWTHYLDGTGAVGYEKGIQGGVMMWWRPLLSILADWDVPNDYLRLERDVTLMLTAQHPERFEKYEPIQLAG